MNVKTTEKGRKKFSKEEKLRIIQKADRHGQQVTLAKYDIYASTFHYWKKKYLVHGEAGLSHRKQKDTEVFIKKLEKENEALKILLAEKELELLGYFINHKKVYRLMFEYLLLEEPRRRSGREFVKYRGVAPTKALEVLEMDIKYVWVYEKNKYAYILTVIDTFSRYVLHWAVGYTMKSIQVKQEWEYIITHYLQEKRLEEGPIEIEVRNDNGKQFNSHLVIDFFKENEMTQVFTHPYTPEENRHVESFHKTLGKALKDDVFTSLSMVEKRLEKFYTTYNNSR